MRFVAETCSTEGSGPPNLPGKGAVNVVYSTTKAALHRFAQGLVKEVKEYNIPAVLIDPGFALTERIEVESQRLGGLGTSRAQSPDIPAKVAPYLCTCPNPMFFSGKPIYSAPFVEEQITALRFASRFVHPIERNNHPGSR